MDVEKVYIEKFFEYLKGRRNVIEDAEVAEYVARLIGIEGVPKDIDARDRVFWQKIRKIKRLFKEQCIYRNDEKTIMDCVYQYKDNKVKAYIRNPILMLMRGIVVRYYWSWQDNKRYLERARLMAVPFAKFFNLGEFELIGEPEPAGLDVVLEKLDDTLIIVWYDTDFNMLRANTRGMIDESRNPYVKAFWQLIDSNGYREELLRLTEYGKYTVMFELVGKVPASMEAWIYYGKYVTGNEKVLGGSGYRAYLLARRNNETLELEYPVRTETVFLKPRSFEIDNIDKLVDEVNKWDASEGVVIYRYGEKYGDGGFGWWDKLVKVKSWRYTMKIRLMGSVDGELNERSLLKYIVLGYLDDLVPILDEEQKKYAMEIADKYSEFEEKWIEFVDAVRKYVDIDTGKIDEKIEKKLRNSCNAGWLIPYILEAVVKGRVEAMARKLVIKSAPRRKALDYMGRLGSRLEKILVCIEN